MTKSVGPEDGTGAPPLVYPEPTEFLKRRSFWHLLRFFGAGAILASVTIGSGETLFASRAGAVFGYTLLWCFVVGAICKGVQVYTAARYITLTGEHPMTHWGLLPGPRNWVPATIGLLSLICFPFFLGALPLVLGELINEMFYVASPEDELFSVYARVWGTVAALVAIFLTWRQSYGLLETVQVFLVGMLLISMMAACVASNPDWFSAFIGSVFPVVPQYQDWVLQKYPDNFKDRTPWIEVITYLGALGGGTYDYIGYVGCLREKSWGAIGNAAKWDGTSRKLQIDTSEQNMTRARAWLLPPKIDVGVSFICVMVFCICFVILGAAVLHTQKIIPAKEGELLTHQAKFLTAFHPSFLWLYQLGVFVAFWGTIYGAYEIYLRTAFECLAPLSSRVRAMPVDRFRQYVLLYCGIGGLTLLWTTTDPVGAVTFPALVGGVFTCGLWCFAMLWVDRHFLPKRLQMGTVLTILTVISGIVLTTLGVRGIWDYISSLPSWLQSLSGSV